MNPVAESLRSPDVCFDTPKPNERSNCKIKMFSFPEVEQGLELRQLNYN
jgi:hypothetical protein